MDEPLTSSDHLAAAGGGGDRVDGGRGPRSTVAEENEGGSLFSFTAGDGGSEPTGSPRLESLAAQYGLLTVEEIVRQDLKTVLWNGAGLASLYLVVGGLWLMIADAWTFTETVYFLTTSLLTIGYGDVVVENREVDRLLETAFILLGLVAATILATCASRAVMTMRAGQVKAQRRAERRHSTTAPTLESVASEQESDVENQLVPDFDAALAIRRYWGMLGRRVLLLSAVVVIGVTVFMVGEGAGFVASLYWCVVTSSTIGYGDVVPTTTAMRWFTSFFSIFATGSMLETLRFAGALPFEIWALRAEGKVFEQFTKASTSSQRAAAVALVEKAATELLQIPPAERTGEPVGRSDVALSVLVLLNRISADDVQQAARIYDKLGIGREGGALPVQTATEPKRGHKGR